MLDAESQRASVSGQRLQVPLVRVAGDRLAGDLRQRLTVRLRDVEHRHRPEERHALDLARIGVLTLDGHWSHDPNGALALANLPPELLPRLEARNLRSLRRLLSDQQAIAER